MYADRGSYDGQSLDFDHRGWWAAALAATGLALLGWLLAQEQWGPGSCRLSRVDVNLLIAVGVASSLVVGASVAVAFARKWWQVVVLTPLVALPVAAASFFAWLLIGFNRCWHF
jgi:hypothetical protein